MSTPEPPELTEEQIRALQAQLDQVTVDHVLVQAMIDLLNVGAHKAGLTADPAAGGAPPADWDQAGVAIEAVRALLPLVTTREPQAATAIRDMVSQLQMAYARARPAGAPGAESAGPAAPAPAGAGGPGPAGPGQPSGPGPAQSSGRLWVPGR
jgi:hypothetical protein